MPTSIRQQIVNAIKTALATIHVDDGFQTDIGEKVTEWRVTGITDKKVHGVDVSDPKDDHFPATTQHQDHDLFIHLKLYSKDGSPSENAAYLRNAIADCYRKVGTDRTWGALARTTEPVTDNIEVDQMGNATGAANVLLKVKYRTAIFNPFSQ